LSIDHQQQLGKTLDSIAKEKAGFQESVPAITVQQEPEAMEVLNRMRQPLSASERYRPRYRFLVSV